ncbi:hypothetical protein J2W57_001222 [Chryseobacterium ginsenosidimutans]|uniref:Uncharacterized protein n=1 Tax=Chryseobacterium geocarposphaerae TaxID=1416776 RepID=A0ABU1LEE2_9FLAO|nr:hypothetical protein [Chryseobacterium geocarposphaerae]MDR6697862.1 hypothetical protein [Chryseobacterium ginsenosidimutans]
MNKTVSFILMIVCAVTLIMALIFKASFFTILSLACSTALFAFNSFKK